MRLEIEISEEVAETFNELAEASEVTLAEYVSKAVEGLGNLASGDLLTAYTARYIADLARSQREGYWTEVRWSSDGGETWSMRRQLTHDSARNHAYARRPVNAQPGFAAFWADGNPDELGISRLYFCNRDGDVWQLPARVDGDTAEPVPWPAGKGD